MPALQMAGIRQMLGGTLYVIYFLGKGRVLPRGKEWIFIIVLSTLNFTLTNGLGTWGVKYISAGLGSIIAAIFPLWLVIFGLFKSEKLPLKAIVGIILGFGGICVIFFDHLADFLDPKFTFGIIISVTATLTWAFGTLYTKKQALEFNPYFSIGLQMMMAGAALLTIAYGSGENIPVDKIPWQSWGAISYLVLFGSVVSFVAYLYALQNLPTQYVSVYAYINPVVAVILGSIIFHEKLTIFIAAGGAITLYGVFLVNQAFRKRSQHRALSAQTSS